MQVKINYSHNAFEWIPYYQFGNIKEICKDEHAIIYLAIWKDGPLSYYAIRESDKQVVLKCLYNSQHMINEFLNEVWYLI